VGLDGLAQCQDLRRPPLDPLAERRQRDADGVPQPHRRELPARHHGVRLRAANPEALRDLVNRQDDRLRQCLVLRYRVMVNDLEREVGTSRDSYVREYVRNCPLTRDRRSSSLLFCRFRLECG